MLKRKDTDNHPVYTMPFSKIYQCYIDKAEKKGRTKDAVDQIIVWMTGYTLQNIHNTIENGITVELFFGEASSLNPLRKKITGVVCGVRVEKVKEPLMQEIRYLDKLIDELAQGRSMDKILRKE